MNQRDRIERLNFKRNRLAYRMALHATAIAIAVLIFAVALGIDAVLIKGLCK